MEVKAEIQSLSLQNPSQLLFHWRPEYMENQGL